MFLVKFRATKITEIIPIQYRSYIFEEFVETEDEDYACKRAREEVIKELEETQENEEDFKIDFIKCERLKIIR